MRDAPSRTAEVVCFMRAVDQLRVPGRVIDDPLARWFLGPLLRGTLATLEASGLGATALPHSPELSAFVIARHRFIDDALSDALSEGIDQLVILGTGYDTRAWRFAEALAGTPVFEVDHPGTATRRAQRVAAAGEALVREGLDRRRVDIDFQSEALTEVLGEAGFRSGARTFVVWEGVSMYLTRAAVKATLADLRALCGAGSLLAMDFWHMVDAPDLVSTARRISPHLLHFLGEPITFGIHPEDVGDFLARLDWRLADLADAPELERRFLAGGRQAYPANYVVAASC